ncbi:MAG: hypothetical protein LBQ90_12395 [Synergistaceae bacterium]|jgi:hypothetical protein|nr:hypothetical protein [Synergistaceae bacterium]
MRGGGLIELVISLCVLGMMIPAFLGAFGTAFPAGLRIGERADRACGAEWWFNRLEFPVLPSLGAMPRTDETGKLRFGWEAETGDWGAVRVTLTVSGGARADAPFVMTRVY